MGLLPEDKRITEGFLGLEVTIAPSHRCSLLPRWACLEVSKVSLLTMILLTSCGCRGRVARLRSQQLAPSKLPCCQGGIGELKVFICYNDPGST